jgi:DNA-binding MarR family transcriptional regulator
MKDGPNIARIASLLGDPARADVLTALMTDRALTATELAAIAGVTKQTMSAHLAKLLDATLVGRLGIDTAAAARQRRTFCRPCMDWSERRHHLAGALGAALWSRIADLKWAVRDARSRVIRLTPRGQRAFRELFETAL